MKRSILAASMMTLCLSSLAQADVTWNFTNAADYYVDGDWWTGGGIYAPVINASPSGGSAYVPARPWINSDDDAYGSDWAAVFARVNTQAYHLKVGDITGGGFTLSGMNHPDAVYGSLYLSPTGGSGSTVMINMSPMGRTGSDGSYIYTFDLNTAADVKIRPTGNWGVAQYTGTFGGAIDWVNASAYSGTYAAFWGPQIGMSGTSGTTFTVSQIQLTTIPAPGAVVLGMIGFGLVGWVKRRFA